MSRLPRKIKVGAVEWSVSKNWNHIMIKLPNDCVFIQEREIRKLISWLLRYPFKRRTNKWGEIK